MATQRHLFVAMTYNATPRRDWFFRIRSASKRFTELAIIGRSLYCLNSLKQQTTIISFPGRDDSHLACGTIPPLWLGNAVLMTRMQTPLKFIPTVCEVYAWRNAICHCQFRSCPIFHLHIQNMVVPSILSVVFMQCKMQRTVPQGSNYYHWFVSVCLKGCTYHNLNDNQIPWRVFSAHISVDN